MPYQKLAQHILNLEGGNIQSNQKNILDEIINLKLTDEDKALQNLSKNDLIKLLNIKEQTIQELKTKKTREPKETSVADYNLINVFKFLKTEDGKIITADNSKYITDEFESAFDKNIRTNEIQYRDYQKKFIQDWSVSMQELVILYYGVGSGKTLIAVNCAEQFILLNETSKVYFLLPASLVLGTIIEFYRKGIDAGRKNADGEYIYNFISYQQMLRSKFDFTNNSLLIIDEVHNMRNIKSDEINEKVSARKWQKSGAYSLVGNKLAESLIYNSNNFIRKLFMTGTLFVNSPDDIESIIALGYSKAPLLNFSKTIYNNIISKTDSFKTYFQGLISYYKISGDTKKKMPTEKYEFIPIIDDDVGTQHTKDPFFVNSRNDSNDSKIDYIIEFLLKHPNQRTLIYSQFLERSLTPLIKELDNNKIQFAVISGKLSMSQKLAIVNSYNNQTINVLIFTLSIKEGISFLESDNIIITQPYWNWSIMAQVVARGIRLNSHKKGYKSKINIKFLVGVSEITSKIDEWINESNKIMNDDILTYKKVKKYKLLPNGKEQILNLDEDIYDSFKSRDIYLYNIMFNKQSEINYFEEKLLKLPKFEDVNNAENNDFVRYYNNEIIDIESRNQKKMTLREMIFLKRRLYIDFYKKQINETNKTINRFATDTKFKSTRNPNLEELANTTKFNNMEDKIQTLINIDASLDDIFKAFGISKSDITTFQANFTPPSQCKKLIDISNIANDTRLNLKILEPTAGIGNIIGELIKLKNASAFNIDANEIFNLYYQIGKTLYKSIDNIIWYNLDYMDYNQKYNYNYILGNPPFNLRLNKEGKDITLYDINFVATAYNQLVDGGTLCFIISNRFTRDKSIKFLNFNSYIDHLKNIDINNVLIEPLQHDFTVEDTTKTTKSQETATGMVIIKLIKLSNFIIDINKKLITGDERQKLHDESLKLKQQKKELALIKKESKGKIIKKDKNSSIIKESKIKSTIKKSKMKPIVKTTKSKQEQEPEPEPEPIKRKNIGITLEDRKAHYNRRNKPTEPEPEEEITPPPPPKPKKDPKLYDEDGYLKRRIRLDLD